MFLKPHDFFWFSNLQYVLIYVICIQVLYSSFMLLPSLCFFSILYSPLEISFPLGHGASILANANYSL
jgi:hypothetical protein